MLRFIRKKYFMNAVFLVLLWEKICKKLRNNCVEFKYPVENWKGVNKIFKEEGRRKTNRNKKLSFVSFKTTVRKNEGRRGLKGERKIASGRKKRYTKQESKTIITNKGL